MSSQKTVEIQKEITRSLQLYESEAGSDIAMMKVIHGDMFYEVERGDNTWAIVYPVQETGESLIIEGMADVFRISKRLKFLDNPSDDLSVYGLLEPPLHIGVKSDGEDLYRYLSIGKKAPLIMGYYAKWDDMDEVFILGENECNTFDKELFSIRERSLFDIHPEDTIVSLACVIHTFAIKLSFHEEDSTWRIDEPFPELARADVMESFIRNIRGLTVKEFADHESIESEELGLHAGHEFIQVTTKSGKVYVLYVGNKTVDGNAYYASSPARSTPILIQPMIIDALIKDPVDFIESRIVPYEPFSVAEFTYQKGDWTNTITRAGQNWLLNEEIADIIKDKAIDDLNIILSNLEYSIILNEAGETQFDFQPEDTLFTFSITSGDATGPYGHFTLSFLAKANGYFVKNSIDASYYEILENDYKAVIALISNIYD